MAMVRLLAFAGAADALGARELEFLASLPCSAEALLESICRAHPRLSPHRASIRLAVNGTWAAADDVVAPGDEVALLPPVSGG